MMRMFTSWLMAIAAMQSASCCEGRLCQDDETVAKAQLQNHVRDTALELAVVTDAATFQHAMSRVFAITRDAKEAEIAEAIVRRRAVSSSLEESAGLRLLGHYLRLSPGAMLAAALPHLDTNDRSLRRVIYGKVLPEIEFESFAQHRGFSYYESHLRATREAPPTSLITYMFWRDPGQALRILMRIYIRDREESRMLLWAEHVVNEALWKRENGFLDEAEADPAALAQLENLSKSTQWWVRLYVAEILAVDAPHRTTVLVTRLSQDTNEHVRNAIKRAIEPPKQLDNEDSEVGIPPLGSLPSCDSQGSLVACSRTMAGGPAGLAAGSRNDKKQFHRLDWTNSHKLLSCRMARISCGFASRTVHGRIRH